MRALVTGATGFIGSHVTRALLRRGYEVRVLVRRGCDQRNIQGLDVEVALGDLCEPASLRAALAGCDAFRSRPPTHTGRPIRASSTW